MATTAGPLQQHRNTGLMNLLEKFTTLRLEPTESYICIYWFCLKFHFAVKKFMERYSGALDKINAVMTKLRTPKLGGELRAVTKLQPVMREKHDG